MYLDQSSYTRLGSSKRAGNGIRRGNYATMRRYFAIGKEAKKKGAGVGNARYRGGGGTGRLDLPCSR